MLRGYLSLTLAQSGSFGLIESQVFREGGRCLFDKRPGLIERQGEAVNLVGNFRGGDSVGFRSRLKDGPSRNQARAAEQEERPVLWLHFVDFHPFCDASGALQTSGDQTVAGWNQPVDRVQVFDGIDVIEDQQPSRVRFEPARHGARDNLQFLFVSFRKIQGIRQGCESG